MEADTLAQQLREEVAALRAAIRRLETVARNLENRISQLDIHHLSPLRSICPAPAKYFVVIHPRPGAEAGIYRTRREFAAAIEAEAGSYQGRAQETIVVHPQAIVSDEGFDSVRAADAYYVSQQDTSPAHHW